MTPAGSAPRLLWLNAVLAVLAVVAAVALVVTLTRGSLSGSSGPDNKESRTYQAVREAATKETLAFMSVDHRKMDDLMARVLAGATGEFKKEYESSSPQLKSAVESQQTVSTGRVLSVGVSDLEARSATVFVAADSQVSNVGTKGAKVPRYYRLQLDLTEVKGKWLVSKLQFVG